MILRHSQSQLGNGNTCISGFQFSAHDTTANTRDEHGELRRWGNVQGSQADKGELAQENNGPWKP